MGALPRARCRSTGSRAATARSSTVAELGDVNGDGFGDYALGLPSADAGGADAGSVYVFLGHKGPRSRRRPQH